MGKFNGTWHSISMVVIIIFILAASGVFNMTSPYEAGDPSLPNTVTVCDKSISLLSGDDNLYNALGSAYGDITDSFYAQCWGIDKSSKLALRRESDYICIYYLDMFGKYPDKCSIYNGITSVSAIDELEAAFGTDCLKAENHYAEIFIDDKEADYEKTYCPENFYSYDFYNDDSLEELEEMEAWFESAAENYPEAEYITVLTCDYYGEDEPNQIIFYVYTTNKTMKGIFL